MTLKFGGSNIWRVERRSECGAILFNRDTKRLGKIKRQLIKTSSCTYCDSKQKLQLDHIKPVILGGEDNPSNLQILCKKHHSVKTKKDIELIVKFRKSCRDSKIDRWEDNAENIIKRIADELYENEKKEDISETNTEWVERG